MAVKKNWNPGTAKLAVVLTALLWSTGGLAIKATNCSGTALTAIRCLICLILFLWIYRGKKVLTYSKLQWAGAWSYFLMAYTFTIGTKLTTAANAVLLHYTAPIFVALLSGWMLKEKVTKADWVTVIVVTGGIAIFFMEQTSSGQLFGDIIALASGLFYALFVIYTRKQKDTSPIGSIILGNAIGLVFGLPALIETHYSLNVIIGGLYFGLIYGGLAFILYAKAITSVSALTAILITTIEPIFNPVWVFLALGERPSLHALIGGSIVIGSLLLRNYYRQRRKSF
ncbi:MAG: DMT family transporter [Burkholderiales bacterium]|nr:DMT family transporter [Burkholderiales bacterium]